MALAYMYVCACMYNFYVGDAPGGRAARVLLMIIISTHPGAHRASEGMAAVFMPSLGPGIQPGHCKIHHQVSQSDDIFLPC